MVKLGGMAYGGRDIGIGTGDEMKQLQRNISNLEVSKGRTTNDPSPSKNNPSGYSRSGGKGGSGRNNKSTGD